jgi:hypothetical protein
MEECICKINNKYYFYSNIVLSQPQYKILDNLYQKHINKQIDTQKIIYLNLFQIIFESIFSI